MTAYLASLPDSEAKSEGIKLGEAIASKLLAARANDGADAPDSYRPRTTPGVYVPTAITVSSTWPKVTPFAMTSPSQFRPSAPVALTTSSGPSAKLRLCSRAEAATTPLGCPTE
jgi:hypothetical protein